MAKVWNVQYTRANRYDEIGITRHMLMHTKKSKQKVTVIDVGCSTGIAMNKAKACLKKEGIKMYTIGIDISSKVACSARKNMNEFIQLDITNVLDRNDTADLVVCANMAICIDGDKQSDIIKKCGDLLKPDGALIVFVNEYREFNRKLGVSPTRQEPVCVESWLDKLGCWWHAPSTEKTMIMNKKNANDFSKYILSEWGMLGHRQRVWRRIRCRINIKLHQSKFAPFIRYSALD